MRVSRDSWFRGLVEKLFSRNTHTQLTLDAANGLSCNER